jgi:hypothetical protein
LKVSGSMVRINQFEVHSWRSPFVRGGAGGTRLPVSHYPAVGYIDNTMCMTSHWALIPGIGLSGGALLL